MAYSTIPAAKSALLTALQARAGLNGTLVQWGVPFEVPADRERVYIGDAKDVDREWAGLGQYRIDETYNLSVHVEVHQEGNDQRACEERMFAIVAEVEQTAVLAAMTGTGLTWRAKPGAMNPQTFPFGDAGWISQVTLNLECHGRIQAA